MRSRILAVAAGFTVVAACSDDPVVENFNAALSGANEVPAVVTAATGTAALVLTEGVLTFNVTANGLSGPVSAAHIHVGAVGQEGLPVFTFTHNAVTSGTVASGTVGTTGLTITRDSLLVLLRNGNAYVNVHTAANPDGEIRGQVN